MNTPTYYIVVIYILSHSKKKEPLEIPLSSYINIYSYADLYWVSLKIQFILDVVALPNEFKECVN